MYDAHVGFEVVAIEVDPDWHGVRATIDAADGRRLTVETDGPGRWLVDGNHTPVLDGCLDIDLEGSALTNTAPVHRLGLDVGAEGDSAAVYVRSDLFVERLDQTYRRLPAEHGFAFEYASPRFDYRATLVFAADGLVADYPGIAERVDVLH